MITNSIGYIAAVVLLIRSASLTSAQNSTTSIAECMTPNRERASCIELEKCTFLYNMVAATQIKEEDKLFLRRSQCGALNGKILVCCPDRYIESQQPQIVSRASAPETRSCGKVYLADRIIGGNMTHIDEFPWMALIEYDKGNGVVGHHCGGSLISDRYVLTAAHCITPGVIPETWTPIRVRLGEWDTSTDRDCEVVSGREDCADPHVDIPIERPLSHPNYVSSSKNQLYDIALLRLSRSVTFSDFIQPICLPTKESLRSVSLNGVTMDVAGWGKTEAGRASSLKLKAEVPGIPLSDCQRVYGGRNVRIENSQMCAGGQKGVDSCNGDSGGGLYALDSSNKAAMYNYIAGVISFGPTPCGLQGWPGVYTKVTSYLDWIQQNMQP